MKRKTANTMKKLVGMKRQQAEQALAEAQQALDRARADLVALRNALAAREAPQDYAALSLAERNGHSIRLIARVRAQEAIVAERQADLVRATATLRRAFGSQQLLGETLRQAG